jgi:hypothetical protein
MSETGVTGKLSPNKALIKRFSEQVVNQGNLDVLDDIVDEQVWFETTVAGLGTGRDAVRKLFKTCIGASARSRARSRRSWRRTTW